MGSRAKEYADWVLSPGNKHETGRYIKLAAQRFLNDLKRTDIYFDEDEACWLTNFGERYCYQWEGDWRDVLIKFENWQCFIFEQVYGWFRRDTGTRRFTKLYLQISKKNGKSTMCAVLGVGHVFADERVNTPKVFTAANNEDQAKICVNMAGRIVERSPDLNEFVEDGEVKLSTYGVNITEVIHKGKDGFIKAMSKEGGDKTAKTSGGKHGINASLGLVDEFGMSPDHGASGSISTSMASRKERLMAYFTTAGFNMEGPCYKELRAQGIKVLESELIMDNYLPIIFELDKPRDEKGAEQDITIEYLINNPKVWKQSNPNLDVSVNRDYLLEMLNDAASTGGSVEVDVKTLNFNMWVDSPSVFISKETWDRNAHGIDESDLIGQECYGGIEISSGKMLSSFVLLFPDIKGKTVLKPYFWMPADFKRENDQLEKWINEGYIWMDSGNVIENDWIVEKLLEEISKYNINSFAFQTNLETHDIVQKLLKNSVKGDPISHGRQGISTPTLMWEEMMGKGDFEHFNNPVMNWQNSNCSAVRKDNQIRLEKSGAKVVGVYAAINSLAQFKTVAAGDDGFQPIMRW